MFIRSCVVLLGAVALAAVSSSAGAQQVSKPTIPGVTNYAQLETTVACGGATTPEAVPELKKMGYASIVNMRLANEPGANVEAEGDAAKAAGIKYFHIPLSGAAPDPAVADKFLNTITTPDNNPAYIHCASGNRVSAMWMIKRMVVDHWDADKAYAEAHELGLTSPALKQFAIDYAQTHKR